MEEAKRLKEETKQKEEDAKLAKDLEWKKHENARDKHAVADQLDKLQLHEFPVTSDNEETELGCVIHGNFDSTNLCIEPVDQLTCNLMYQRHEALISTIIQLSWKTETDEPLKESIYVAIPYVVNRVTQMSRETFVRALDGDHWQEIPSKDVVFEKYKDIRFVQVELKQLTTLAVMSRFKRDYITLTRNPSKVTSSFDQRITITVEKDTFSENEHLLLQVQPVDASSLNDLRSKNSVCKRLLTSSPIVETAWESTALSKPLLITLPCPPNPAKAKKLAQARALKEERMKNPRRAAIMLPDEVEREKERENKKKQQQLEFEEHRHTRWYMGDYAHSDDDETDSLWLLSGSPSGRWFVVSDVKIEQIKVDLLQFELEKPLERFTVLRTRPNMEEEAIAPMASALSECLSKCSAQVIIRQREENPFDTIVGIAPVNKVERVLRRLAAEGYDCGPVVGNIISLDEGDTIQVRFKGNIKNVDNVCPQFIYNTNLKSQVMFSTEEVDRYLQKNYSMYRGVIQIFRLHSDSTTKPARRTSSFIDDAKISEDEIKSQLLSAISYDIPKYHVERNTTPIRAPITILNPNEPISEDLIRHLSVEIGEEWQKVANYLNISRVRIQSILRNAQTDDKSEDCARYEMLMTWLKKMPKAADKVAVLSTALNKSGRGDLAEDLRTIKQEYEQQGLSQKVS